MRYVDEFRDGKLAKKLVREIESKTERLAGRVTIMEVCGSHTMSIYRYGIKSLLPESIRLIAGPGCPICVTPIGYIDTAIELSRQEGVCITTFGDMIRVPGSKSSLAKERGRGRDIRVVYSPLDAVRIARQNPVLQVVFLGVGFETTAPSVAASIQVAKREGLPNFSVLAAHKVIPEPMEALTQGELQIDGYLCPGHVSVIIGQEGYRPLAERYGIPCVIAGFEPLDVLRGIGMILAQLLEGRSEVENEYRRVVRPLGNPKAQALIHDVFDKVETPWRGLGSLPNSGLAISKRYEIYDAGKRFSVSLPEPKENPACICGEVLKGVKEPLDCKLFGKACTPDHPLGSCMVSSEGTCAAEYRYGEGQARTQSEGAAVHG
jgi:hydrogenase expression/formation protein HypD